MPKIPALFTHKKILPVLVLASLLVLAALALLHPPAPDRARPDTGPRLTVETMAVSPTNYQVMVPSYGTVQPRTQSTLVSQVSGEVIWVNPQFRDGGVFDAGDPLLRIDPRDYEANMQIAREEQAQSQQALADWERLGDGSEPDALVLRKPQLMAARAAVASAEAELRKAELDLERATITAPFDGRILSTEVDLGEVLGSSSQLAEIYATDYVEIRLPLANADLDYVQLPEPRPAGEDGKLPRVPVSIHSSLSGGADWQGFLVRTEGAIDDSSRQLHVVAQVDDPFQLDSGSGPEHTGRKPLKIGEYVTASIRGLSLPGAVVIATSTIYQGSYVYVVSEGLLQRREIAIAWQNGSDAVIDSGLEAGDRLVTTPLGQVTSGTRVAVAGGERKIVQGARPGAAGGGGEAAR